jgi:uncharacterized repeat protein (TIGR04076 family)
MQFTSVGQVMAQLDRDEVTVLLELADGVDLQPVKAVMVERRGACPLEEGTCLRFGHPAATPEAAACPALLRSLRPFVAAAALGIPSAEPGGYLVSCPGRKGTVWRVEPVSVH